MEALVISPISGLEKRDKRVTTADQHNPRERGKTAGKFQPSDFMVDAKAETVPCPAGKPMGLTSGNPKTFGIAAMPLQAHVADCKEWGFRRRYPRNEKQKSPRQFVRFKTHFPEPQRYAKRMRKKIDTEEGRHEYSKRLTGVEPVFAHIASTLGLNRFRLRGQPTVAAQWLAFCLVHGIGKIQRYGMAF